MNAPTYNTPSERNFNIETRGGNSHDAVTIEVSGELDLANSAQLRKLINELIDSCHDMVIVDLADLSFIDAKGLGALVGASNYAKQQGKHMKVRMPTGRAKVLFELTRLDEFFAQP